MTKTMLRFGSFRKNYKQTSKLVLRHKFLFACFLVFSCSYSNNFSKSNEAFEKKYSKNVEAIKLQRTPPKNVKNEIAIVQSPSEINAEYKQASMNDEYYAYTDVSRFGENYTPQNYTPNGQTYQQAISAGKSLPPNIFEVGYNTTPYPPFQKAGDEFDQIQIPTEDAYGVKTKMTDKTYLLVGNKSLQRNIDEINSNRSKSDIEISKILIAEQKELRRKKKMIKSFGKDSLELAALEEEKPPQKTEKTEEKIILQTNHKVSQNQTNKISGFIRTIAKNNFN